MMRTKSIKTLVSFSVFALILSLCLLSACKNREKQNSQAASFSTPNEQRVYKNVGKLVPVKSLPGAFYFAEHRDWMLPLNQPAWKPATSVEMRSDDPVVGIFLDEKAWVLPWFVLKNHHVANLDIEGRPILITFCEACSSSSAFDPVIKGKKYTFRVVGIYNGTHFVSDYETNSLWNPFAGQALAGPLKGTSLVRLRLLQCLWSEWPQSKDSTLVVDTAGENRGGHGHRMLPGGSPVEDGIFFPTLVRPLDKRLPSNDLVLGISMNGNTKAYPLKDLDAIVNDTIGSEEVVIIHKTGTMMASAFSRKFEGDILTFEKASNGQFVDGTHRVHWSPDGEALNGSAKGRSLQYVNSGVEEWYVWAAYHPDTEIFQRNLRE